jgi:hypothetical protein
MEREGHGPMFCVPGEDYIIAAHTNMHGLPTANQKMPLQTDTFGIGTPT